MINTAAIEWNGWVKELGLWGKKEVEAMDEKSHSWYFTMIYHYAIVKT